MAISAVLYTPFMLSSRVLQREPISLHWTILGCFLPGFRSHEDSMRPHFGVAAL